MQLKSQYAQNTRAYYRDIGKHKNLDDVANECNLILQGWINYYAQYNKSELCLVFRHFNLVVTRLVDNSYFNERRKNHDCDLPKK
jgi:hypothetical protein